MKYYERCLLVIFTLVIINGCNPGMIALKGNYANTPVIITSSQTMDSIWSAINGLFTDSGLIIKK